MNDSNKNALASNLQTLLTTLAQVAIEEELSYNEFAEIARLAFVRAAKQVLDGKKRASDSRISIVTGIHRKDVARLREQTGDIFNHEKSKGNRAIAVISAWAREKDYCDAQNQPLPLAYDNKTPSLTTLIKKYSGDMPVRAMCDEMERMGVIVEKGERWHLNVPAYVPNKSREAIFDFLGEDTASLIKTIHHNLNNPPRKRRFQRSVAYDELTPETVELFQAFASERAMDLLKEFDIWLSKREKLDKIERKKQPSLQKQKAGMGIYYFEYFMTDESDGDKQ